MEDISIETIRRNLAALKEKATAITGTAAASSSSSVKRSPSHDIDRKIATMPFQEEETPSMVFPRPASSLPTPTPHYLPTLNSEAPSINSIIDRTQSLLHRVKNSRTYNDSKPLGVEMNETRKLLSYNDTHLASNNLLVTRKDFNPNVEYLDSDLTEIDLLLRGVPEAYDDEPEIDDEMVENLLKVGGPPPSQLELPSLYASNQRVMERLSKVVEIKVSVQHLLVYSSKYGVRREGSYLLVRGPKCYPQEDDLSQPRYIPLPELKKKDLLLMSDKKDHLKNYFVGDVDIDKVISFPVRVDDRLVHDWLQGKNGIEIEMYSYLAPPGSKSSKGALNSQVLFAKSVISMGGILGTKGLDAIINSDFQVDVSNHSVVLNRMRAISVGQNVKPLSSKLGIVSLRVALLDGEIVSSSGLVAPETVFQQAAEEEHKGSIEVEVDVDTADHAASMRPKKYPVDKALQYCPSEVKYPPSTYVDDTDPKIELKTFTKPSKSKKYFALALFNIAQFALSQSVLDCIRFNNAMLRVLYKFSLKDSDSVEVELQQSHHLDNSGYVLNVALGKVNICHEVSLKFPVLELWLEFAQGNALQRRLLGRSRSSYECEDKKAFSLPIYDGSTLQEIAQIKMAYFRGEDGYQLEDDVQLSLDQYAANPDVSTEKVTEEPYGGNLRDSLDSQLSIDSLSNDNLLADISHIKEHLEDLHLRPTSIALPAIRENASHRVSLESQQRESDAEDEDDIVALLNSKPRVVVPPTVSPSTSSAGETGAHILDIAIHGNCVLQAADGRPDLLPIIGCHVCYSLPSLKDQDTTNARKLTISEGSLTESMSMYSVWWDSECAILNSVNRHRFECSVDRSSVGTALGINPNVGLVLYIVDCDENGNLPKDITPFAKVVLDMDSVSDVLRSNVAEKLIKLPLQYLQSDHRQLLHPHVVLKCSHRWEPVLLNKSQEGKVALETALADQPTSGAQSVPQPSLYDVVLPLQSSSFGKQHLVDFVVEVDQFSHLRLPHKNSALKGKLFFSLSVIKDYKMNKLNQHVIFSELFPWEEQFLVDKTFSLPCPLTSVEQPDLDEDLLFNSAMKDVAKSSLVLNLYDRLVLFPKGEDLDAASEYAKSSDSYPPLHVRATDKFVGTAVIDLSVLAIGMPYIEGWYNLLDELQHVIGQMKLKVVMREGTQSGLTNIRGLLDSSAFPAATDLSDDDVIRNATEEGEPVEYEESIASQHDEHVEDDVDHAVDESLIDIKAMEYAALRRLLEELEVTKERLLVGWLPATSSHAITEQSGDDLQSHTASTGASYESDFTSESLLSSLPQSSPTKSTSDHVEYSLYSSNFSDEQSHSEDAIIERIMQEFDKVAEYPTTTAEVGDETPYSSDFESYTTSVRDHAQFEEGTPNFTANLESPIRFPGGRIDWVVEDAVSESSHVVSSSEYTQSFSVEEVFAEEKLQQDYSSTSSMMNGEYKDDEDMYESTSILSRGMEDSHVTSSRCSLLDEQKEHDDHYPAPTPEWKKSDIKCEADYKHTEDLTESSYSGLGSESKGGESFQDHLEYLEECSVGSVGDIELSPMSMHEDTQHSFREKTATEAPSESEEKQQPVEAEPSDWKQCKDCDEKDDSSAADIQSVDYVHAEDSVVHSVAKEEQSCLDESSNVESGITEASVHTADTSVVSEASIHGSSSKSSELSRHEDKQVDSPMTAKIRVLVNEEVDRLMEHKYHPVAADTQVPEPLSRSILVPGEVSSERKALITVPRMNLLSLDDIERALQQDVPVVPPTLSTTFVGLSAPSSAAVSAAKSDAEILQDNLRQIQESLLVSKRPHRHMLAKLPGRHRSFIDAETERVSKIMMGALGSAHK